MSAAVSPVEVEIPHDNLTRSLSHAKDVADAKSATPFARLVLLTVGPGGVTFDASSIALGWRSEEPGQKPKAGSVAINCHDFAARVANLPKGAPVRLKVDGGTLKATAVGKARSFSLPVLDASDVPPPQEPEDEVVEFDVNGAQLGALLAAAFHARSTDATRDNMACVQLAGRGGQLVARATDGHRAVRVRLPLEGVPDFAALIPERGIGALRNLCAQWTTIKLTIGERRLFAAGGASTRLCVSLVQAAFPSVDRVLTISCEVATNAARIHRETLIESLKALRSSAGKEGQFDLFFRPDGMLELFGPGQDGAGEGRDEVPYSSAAPIKASAHLNVAYLADALISLSCEEVEIRTGAGELDAITLHPVEGARPDSVCVVMPMR